MASFIGVRFSWLLCFLAVVLPPVMAHAQAAPLRIGVHDDPPFVIKSATGEWSGISIELARTIASEMGTTIEVHETSREDIVGGPLPAGVDLVATLNISEKMNARYDLSHAFYSTGLSIAVPETAKESAWSVITRIFSGGFFWIAIGVTILLVLVGMLMWWVEKRPIEPLPKEKQALSRALFWAFEPVIGYKASQHATRAGRVLGTIWGLFGVVLVSGLTANLASQLTAHRLAPSVRDQNDLPRVRVAVVAHTAGKKYCDRHGIRRKEVDTIEEALLALERGEVEAVVDDAPNLAYATRDAHKHVQVLPGTFANHSYTFGLLPDSPLRHAFNKALVTVINGENWSSLVASYLGRYD